MTFAPYTRAAHLAIVAALFGTFATATPSPSWADGNLRPMFVGHDETILLPVPDCSKCLALIPGDRPDDPLFSADCLCAD